MNIFQKPSLSFNERRAANVSIIVLHYTGMKSCEDALERLTDKDSGVSAHYTVDEDGAVYQHVDEAMRAWHAGKSFWGSEADLNSMSIGVEIVNPGHEHGYRAFPKEQIDAVVRLCQAIQSRHGIDYVLAHSDIAPLRKKDPGELFPWEALAARGVGAWPAVSDEDVVKSGGIDFIRALNDFGYGEVDDLSLIVAFQRHFVPEVFVEGTQGEVCRRTKSRIYALLAGHLISPNL